MTREEIEQKAELYAELLTAGNKERYRAIYTAAKEGYVSGAHSRDEEIENLQIDMYGLQGSVDLWKGEAGKANSKIRKLEKELNKLRNPWISVKDRLPEMFVDSKGITHDFSVKVLVTNENNSNHWHVAEYYPNKNEWCCLEHTTYIMDNVTHWMPILKLN